MTAGEMQELDRYLEEMGVEDTSLRAKLQGALPWTDLDSLVQATATSSSSTSLSCIRLNSSLATDQDAPQTVFVIHDATGSLAGLRGAFAHFRCICYGLLMPEDIAQWRDMCMESLARIFVATVYDKAPNGPYVLCGIGLAGSLAHEIALQLNHHRPGDVEALLLFEDPVLREAWDMAHQPWFKLYPFVEEHCPEIDLHQFSIHCQTLRQEKDASHQVEHVLDLEPASWNSERWNAAVEDALREASWSGYGWEETLLQWCALYHLVQRHPIAPSITLDQFLLTMSKHRVLEMQLEFLTDMKPENVLLEDWDRSVNQSISKMAHFKYLSSRYRPKGLFMGASVFYHVALDGDVQRLLGGWAAGCFSAIARLIQPASLTRLSSPEQESPITIASEIETAMRDAMRKRQARENCFREIQKQTQNPVRLRILNDVGQSASILEKRDVAMVTSLPVWVAHDEQGRTSGHIQALCSALPCPCLGLELNTVHPDQFDSIDHLAHAYVSLVQKIQPEGPYLILGISLCGSMVAQAMACVLEACQSLPVMLVLLDGSCRRPAASLHRPTWYSLFFALREIGALKLGIGDFVEHVKTGTTPSEQLRMLRAFKSDIPDEEWNQVVFNAMHKSNVLERLMKRHPARQIFKGPVATLLPEDRLGDLFLSATRSVCQGSISYTPIELGHTELLLTPKNRKITLMHLIQTIQLLMEM